MFTRNPVTSCIPSSKKEVKQFLRNIAFVSEQLAIQAFSKNLEHIWVLVADICTSKYKRYYLASVIARKVELKAMKDNLENGSVETTPNRVGGKH